MPAIQRNMDPKKCPMPSQDPNVRNKNFDEVALGYTPLEAVGEAMRCLNCREKPCVAGCPIHQQIPEFLIPQVLIEGLLGQRPGILPQRVAVHRPQAPAVLQPHIGLGQRLVLPLLVRHGHPQLHAYQHPALGQRLGVGGQHHIGALGLDGAYLSCKALPRRQLHRLGLGLESLVFHPLLLVQPDAPHGRAPAKSQRQ